MKIKRAQLNHGHISFLKKKKIPHYELSGFFEMLGDNIELNQRGFVKNPSDLISDNWNKFHTWINTSLNNGTIKGEAVSTATPETQDRKVCAKYFRALSPEIKNLCNFTKRKPYNYGNLFSNFHRENGTVRKHYVNYDIYLEIGLINGHNIPSHLKYLNDFKQIIEDGLVEKFKTFTVNELQRKKSLRDLKKRSRKKMSSKK